MTDTTASGLPAATTGRARVLWSDETQPDTSIGSRKATPAQVVAEGAGGAVGAIAAALGGIGGAAALSVGTTAGTVAAGNDGRIVGAAQTSSLGNASTRNIGTTAGTAAAGDDSRIVNAVPSISTGADVATPGASALMGNDIIPMIHAQRLRTEASPVVVFTGTSIGTYGAANAIMPQDSMQGMIRAAVLGANPKKNFTFYDRAIGGSGTNQLAGALAVQLANRPSWWVGGTGLEWLANIQTLAPTQIYMMLAENDSGNINATYVNTILTTIAGWTNPPDIIFATPRPIGTAPGTLLVIPQTYLRTLSKSGLVGQGTPNLSAAVIDMGRWVSINVVGLDFSDQFMSYVVGGGYAAPLTGQTFTSGVYTFAGGVTQGDVIYDVTFPGQAGTMWNSDANILQFALGGNSLNQLQVQKNGSRINATYYPATSTVVGGVNYTATGDVNIIVSAKNEHLYVLYNGTVVFDGLIPRMMYGFQPSITQFSPPATVPTMTVNNYAISTPRQYRPNMSLAIYYGAANGQNAGNGVNHPSSIGLTSDRIALQALNFSAAPWSPDPTSSTLTGNYSVSLASSSRQSFDPNGANRVITLPTITASNTPVEFAFHNSATSGAFGLTFNNAGGGAVGTLANGATLRLGVKSDGTWMVM